MMKPKASIANFKEKNVLLARDDVGRAKPTTHDLPTGNHVFGVPNKKENYGAGKLTAEWDVSKKSDFKSMP